MRAADRRTLAEDLDLLADHLKRVYALSVSAVHPPLRASRFPTDIGQVAQAKIITVKLSEEFPKNMPHGPPANLDFYEIEYVVIKKNDVSHISRVEPF